VPSAGIWLGFRGDRGKKPHRRYRSVISVSGCETIVMNQTVLKTSNQKVRTSQSSSRNAVGVMAIDSSLQNCRRLEHDYGTRRNRHLGASLRLTADTLTFLDIFCLDIFCHSSVSLQFQSPDHREMRIAAEKCQPGYAHPFIKTLSFGFAVFVVANEAAKDTDSK